ncbi:hypothetical protein [Natrialba aegyptia]|uniref:Sulfatase N-terminal domain-containing protein n=1 Tax=Natrialba aegyptia DSM 13077 TaxID=1227491 RepID=M0B130_9EURY|nr:hypothetical protein [Natrialba aegyptia]ELZ04601.1 hypothetical protein C480_13841 [Natrialba aegyptia DSM 13077]
MALSDFLSQYQHAVDKHGALSGSRLTAEKAVERALVQLGKRINYGERPIEKEWDVLIILDACRADLFAEFAPQHPVYDEFETTTSIYSCASTSSEWFRKAFGSASDQELSKIHYLSANLFSDCVDPNRFHEMTELWRFVEEDEKHCDPAEVTAEALRANRESDAERLVIHYIPPHAPFLHCEGKYELENPVWRGDSHQVWLGLQSGEFDRAEVWNDYGQNLLTVLDEVDTLLTHLSGTIAITADHANGLGELGVYGHPGYSPVPAVKRVPWVTAVGQGQSYSVSDLDALMDRNEGSNTDEQLEALGYL